MRTRKTSDYSPTLKGSKEENMAINARREMLGWMAANPEPVYPPSKWQRRMQAKAKGFTIN